MIKFLKKIAPFLILVSFLILSALLPEILGEDAKTLAENYLGENYKYILVVFFLLLFLLAAYINPEMGLGLFSKTDKNKPERYNIPPTDENHELLRKAKAAVAASHTEQALELLSTLKLKTLDVEITALSARLADLGRTQRFGTESYDTITREHNKINKNIILIIANLEKEIAQLFEFYDKIRATLKTRYETRLSQKLSNRQPVNLRLAPSNAGTTTQSENNFVQYSEGQVREKLAEYYKDAHGRLLLLGVPGAGKTTLLLQLELELLKQETTRIPVILNLARWSSEFPTLEDWIQEILPSEMGLTINKKNAGDLITQGRLILLLDGLDEAKEEDRETCLKAISIFGEDSSRRFIISSRINEYKALDNDVPVNVQVEVGTLTYEQLVEQLKKIDPNEGSRRLLLALEEDKLLCKIAEVPFYFNILQLLFARGKFLHEFNFSAWNTHGRQEELVVQFTREMLSSSEIKEYSYKELYIFLSFLASKLNQEKILYFELNHLQYSWCGALSILDILIGGCLRGLVHGAIGILGGSLIIMIGAITNTLNENIFIALGRLLLIVGLIGVSFGPPRDIETRERVIWDWKIFFAGFPKIFFLFPILMLVLGEFVTALCTLAIIMAVRIASFLEENNLSLIQVNFPYQRFITSIKVLHFSILQHWHVYHILRKKRLLPKKLVFFLNEMVRCNILETTGSSWRFRHRILQDHFKGQYIRLGFIFLEF